MPLLWHRAQKVLLFLWANMWELLAAEILKVKSVQMDPQRGRLHREMRYESLTETVTENIYTMRQFGTEE